MKENGRGMDLGKREGLGEVEEGITVVGVCCMKVE